VGQLVDVSFTYTLNKYVFWSAYYGHAFGDAVTRNAYQLKNDADYGFVEVNVSF
jgi:hypothetical protein